MATVSDAQESIHDLLKLVDEIRTHLECAESCVTKEDFRNNIASAEGDAKSLAMRLAKLYKSSGKLSK